MTTEQEYTTFAEKAGYSVERIGGNGAPYIDSPGKFEREHPRAVWLYCAAMEGDALADESFGDSAWAALVKDEAGEAWSVGEDSQGFVNVLHVNAANVDSEVAAMEARNELRGYLEEPETARAEGVPFVADPGELDAITDSGVAVFVTDHGNASLMARDESGAWSERASFV